MSLSPVLERSSGIISKKPSARSEPRVVTSDGRRLFANPLLPMLTTCAVAMLTFLSISLGKSSDGVVVMWVANGVAVAIWARAGKGLFFDLSFGGLMAAGLMVGDLLAGYHREPAMILTAANLVEMVAGVLLLRRFVPGLSLSTVRSTMTLIGVGAVAAPLIGAVGGAIALATLKGVPLLEGFQMWWFGHALGMMLILPLILSVDRRSLLILRRPVRALEWAALLGGLTAMAYAHYFLSIGSVSFILNMLLVVVAARLRMAGIVIAMLAVAVIMFAALLYGPTPHALSVVSVSDRILTAQLLLLSISLPFMLVATLLTERDGLSERARLGQRRAELASASKSRLLANVAHEIKSPVAGMIGIGELWSGGQLGPVSASQKEMADMLVKTARQVETLAHDLLDVARAESGAVKVELRPTDVVGVIEDVSRSTAMRGDAQGLKIEIEADGIGLVALADSQRLTQVIDNFATNAVKYGAAGGVIVFRAMPCACGVRIEVSDKGPGLSEQKQTQLFEPFNRLGLERSSVEGHGIGLALAKRLVELQGGFIGVDSAPGEGATFWVELPAA